MVTLKALEAAITQVESLRDHELTFEAGGTVITLRPLRPHEETEVQRYAQIAWEGTGEDGDTAAYQDFMDRVRNATLGFSVVRIGDIEIRDDFVETGELDDHGNRMALPKWEAVRDMVSMQWTKPMLLQVFSKFGELLERVEISASKKVRFEPADLDEEIQRLEKRVADLKAKREDFKPSENGAVGQTQKAVVEIDKQQAQARKVVMDAHSKPSGRVQDATDAVVGEMEVPSQAAEPQATPQRTAPPQRPQEASGPFPTPQSQGRPSSVPQQAAPPERVPEPPEAESIPEAPAPIFDEHGIELPHEGDSFFDPSDPEAAMAAEARRQAALHQRTMHRARERKMAQQKAEALGVPTSADLARERMRAQHESQRPAATNLGKDPRTASLREAANLRDQVFDTGAGRVQSARPQRATPTPQPQGGRQVPTQLHGKPVYKMAPQTLDRKQRSHGDPAESPVQTNPEAGGRQPKFRGPQE